jgi:4-hydroxy-3-polyprenylbenzoate decarboxylase
VDKNMDIVIGITGASGVIYGLRLLEILRKKQDCNLHLIISKNASQLIEYETNNKIEDVTKLADSYYDNSDLTADIASGSKLFNKMIIVPCTMSTAAKINTGISDNLISRVADVSLKERRQLIIVPRETPLNTTHLNNLLELSKKGVVILPSMPAFYHKPKNIKDQVNFITGKILDVLGIEHDLFKRWSGEIGE